LAQKTHRAKDSDGPKRFQPYKSSVDIKSMSAGALIKFLLCLDVFSSTEQYTIEKYRHLVKLVSTKHPNLFSWFPVNISLVEPFLDHRTLFSLKRLPSEALVFYSGIFWLVPDISVDGSYLETDP
jgi:hypothetical protein